MSAEDFLHQEIYATLEDWATRFGELDDQIVASLLEDLKNEENLAIWATLNPFEFLPNPKISKGETYLKWAKIAAMLRNVSVFIPVALTWKAVSEATSAFGSFVEQNSASTVNFLAFWQNGYDVLSQFWTIGHIASLDFMIIIGVVVLSLVNNLLNNLAFKVKSELTDYTAQERLQLGLTLKFYLYSLREIDKGNIKEGIAASVAALQNATRALTKSSIEINIVMSGLKGSIPVVNEFGSKMQKETQKLNNQVALLTNNLSDINTSIVEELRDAVNSATEGLRIANNELESSTSAIKKNALDAEKEIKSFQGLIKKASKKSK